MSDSAFGDGTGRYFIYDDYNACLVTRVPDHDEFHVWAECGPDEDGAMWYVSSDPDGYILDADEFGPFTEDDVLTKEQLKDMRLIDDLGGLS